MKERPDAILHPRQASYLQSLLPPRDGLLAEMEAVARATGVPISDPEVGALLSILSRSASPAVMLEIGTAIGYGTVCLLRGAPDARMITIDHDAERLLQAKGYLDRAGLGERVELRQGDALEHLSRLDQRFGLVYIDAVKQEYRRYLDLVLPMVEIGGLIVVDNLLWKGRVAEPPEEGDERADAVRKFNPYFVIHPQIEATILPLGDGLGVGVKTRPTVMETGGPY